MRIFDKVIRSGLLKEKQLMKRKKYPILIYIKNINEPASFYRLAQYMDLQEKEGVVKFVTYNSDKVYHWYYDSDKGNEKIKKIIVAIIGFIRVTYYIIWDMLYNHSSSIIVGRKIYPRKMPVLGEALLNIYFKSRVVYWDFDDNIIFDNEITAKEVNLLTKHSKNIIVTSEYLMNTVHEEYRHKVKLLPTTDIAFRNVDIIELINYRYESYKKRINLLWIGTKSNLCFLQNILPYLEKAAEKINLLTGKKVFLEVVCNRYLEYDAEKIVIKNIKWTRQVALEAINAAHIGLMPLIDSEYTKGKGGFKGIQYISAGIPCVISDIGYNRQVIGNSDCGFLIDSDLLWCEKVVQLGTDEELWRSMSVAARRRWEERFLSDDNQNFWKAILEGSDI